jgi:AGCS family alanine or glycine:cation symporter
LFFAISSVSISAQQEVTHNKIDTKGPFEYLLEPEVGPGTFDFIDEGAGTVVGVLGAVMFYDLGADYYDFEKSISSSGTTAAELAAIVDRINKLNGKDATSVDYDLMWPLIEELRSTAQASFAASKDTIHELLQECAAEADFTLEEAVELTLTIPTGFAIGSINLDSDELKSKTTNDLQNIFAKAVNEIVEGEKLKLGIKFSDDADTATLKVTRHGVPIVVLWLVLGAIFFTFRMGFINLRGLGHSIKVVSGRFTNPNSHGIGEVTHFQALASALSATVGLGNIAGVAIAVSMGGPGAIFWMVVAGFLGMSSKFVECTLGQKYREVRPNGEVMGGAMFYLSKGLKEMKMPILGKVLAVMFAVLCIGGSFGGGNTFQVNQSLNAIQETVPFFGEHRWVYGLIMTIVVGVVIIGGIKRIASTAEKIVPAMCGVYVAACLAVLFNNFDQILPAFSTIWDSAINPDAAYGGFIGVLVMGFKRAAFSNEAGVGSAAIAHSAAKTDYPVREGIVALLEPFIDTIIVCTMTGLVIVITGAYDATTMVDGVAVYAPYLTDANGAGLTSQAFASQFSWFPMILGVAVALFAFSTMISWSYYGERCWAYLFGDNASMSYKITFLTFTFLGSVITSQNVLDFGDLMILGMAFPNVLGVVLLSGKVKRDLNTYWKLLKSGAFKEYK